MHGKNMCLTLHYIKSFRMYPWRDRQMVSTVSSITECWGIEENVDILM